MIKPSRHLDLVAAICLCATQIALVLAVADGLVQAASGLVFTTFLPGYALLAALYPALPPGLSTLEQAILSIPASVAVTTLGGFAMNTIGWTLPPERNVLWLAGITIALCAVAAFRRPVRAAPSRRVASFLVPVIAIASVGVAGVLVTNPSEDDQTVQLALYVLDRDGQVPAVPVPASIGQPVEFTLGLAANGERQVTLVAPDQSERQFVVGPNGPREEKYTIVPTAGSHRYSWSVFGDGNSRLRSVSVWVDAR